MEKWDVWLRVVILSVNLQASICFMQLATAALFGLWSDYRGWLLGPFLKWGRKRYSRKWAKSLLTSVLKNPNQTWNSLAVFQKPFTYQPLHKREKKKSQGIKPTTGSSNPILRSVSKSWFWSTLEKLVWKLWFLLNTFKNSWDDEFVC